MLATVDGNKISVLKKSVFFRFLTCDFFFAC